MAKRVATLSFAAGLVLLVLLVVGAVWVALRGSPPAPRVSTQPFASVTFVGYTNDASGALLANFAITNLSEIAIARAPKCLICFATPTRGWTPKSGVLLAGGRVLEPGGSEIVTIHAPATQTPWRVSFYVSNEVGLKRLINTGWRLMKLPSWYAVKTRQIDSGRIGGPNAKGS